MSLHTFNQEQTLVHQISLNVVKLDSEELRGFFFTNTPGGYGKTFLLETVLSIVCSVAKIAIAVASNGIAAELLEGGCLEILIPISNE